MSTDSTELTFVRCPSCRSLVPAISSRCRMCGATLDASSSAGAPEGGADQEAKKSGRVRQRTMSEPSGEVASAVSATRAESTSSAEQAPAPIQATSAESTESANDDPLSAYIEEVEVAEEHSSTNGGHAAKQASVAASLESDESDDDLDDVEEPATPVVEKREERREEKPSQPKVLVESGNRRPGQGSNLSFGRSREGDPAPKAPEAEKPQQQQAKPAQQEARPTGEQRQQHHREDPRPQQRDERKPHQEQRREERRPQQDQRGHDQRGQDQRGGQQAPRDQHQARNEQNSGRHDRRDDNRRPQEDRGATHQARPQQSSSQPERAASGPHTTSAQRGKLFGWLVSYSDALGTSIELREGKFFITGRSLKTTDLVIEDKSISMPHALVVIGSDSGFMVQDLMSERGVFVRHSGNEPYKREEESITLHHGDWVKFGDVEYLVSLINP